MNPSHVHLLVQADMLPYDCTCSREGKLKASVLKSGKKGFLQKDVFFPPLQNMQELIKR